VSAAQNPPFLSNPRARRIRAREPDENHRPRGEKTPFLAFSLWPVDPPSCQDSIRSGGFSDAPRWGGCGSKPPLSTEGDVMDLWALSQREERDARLLTSWKGGRGMEW